MKKILLVILAASTIMLSCNRKKEEQAPVIVADSVSHDSTVHTINADVHYFWTADWDNSGNLIMNRLAPVSKDSLSAEIMINRMNELYPEIRLHFLKMSNDTIFTQIAKSSYLTQQMGTSGAETYLAEVTFNLTEINGINNVDIKFKAGDHAEPGTYSRTDFVHELKMKNK